ncbi:MAG: hypothetical protein ACLTSL_04785 [Odoribacter splanchnicus]
MPYPLANYQLVFLITCTDNAHISTCIESVSKNNDSLNCLVLLLLQNNISIPFEQYITPYTFIKVLYTDHIIPLSQARNILLKSEDIVPDAYYMFPDDDSVFDRHFFDSFQKIIKRNTLIAVKGSQNKTAYFLKMPDRKIASVTDFNKAISVNMVIKGTTIALVGDFDEKLGVGNYYGAGEDNDYFLRCSAIEQFVFTNDLWNYHPLPYKKISQPVKSVLKRYKSYGRGVIYMLLKHGMHAEAFKVVIRGYLGAIKNIILFNWKMGYVYFIAANVRFYTFLKNIGK